MFLTELTDNSSLLLFASIHKTALFPHGFHVLLLADHDRQEQTELFVHVETLPCWCLFPTQFQSALLRLFFTNEDLRVGDHKNSSPEESRDLSIVVDEFASKSLDILLVAIVTFWEPPSFCLECTLTSRHWLLQLCQDVLQVRPGIWSLPSAMPMRLVS